MQFSMIILILMNMYFLLIRLNNHLVFFGVINMYCFASYKLMVDLLAVHGIDMPISVNRSTLHRWRVADSVPSDMFRLIYYYTCRSIDNNDLHIDLLDMLETCGFSIKGLI